GSLAADFEHLGLLGRVRVLVAGVDVELGGHGTTAGVVREHAEDGVTHGVTRTLRFDLCHREVAPAARILRVAEVAHVETLVAGHRDLVRIDDDDEVTVVMRGGISLLVLADEQARSRAGKPAENRVAGVDHSPLALNRAGMYGHRSHLKVLLKGSRNVVKAPYGCKDSLVWKGKEARGSAEPERKEGNMRPDVI